MKNSFKNFLKKIINIGVSESSDVRINLQIKNLNSLLLYGAVILFLSFSTFFITKEWSLYNSIVYIGGFGLILGCFILNHNGYYRLSAPLAYLGLAFIFCIGAIIDGGLFICCLLNLLLMVISLRFLETKRESIIYSSIQLFMVIATIWIVGHKDYGFDNNAYVPAVRIIVFVLIFVFLFSVIQLFLDQIRNSIKRINKLVTELEAKNTQVELAYHEMENFAHKISHDLKAPLRNMNTYATLLQKDITRKKDENLEDYSNKIYTNGVKLSKMIDDVLAYSKMNAKQVENVEFVNLRDIIGPIQNDMKQIYPKSEIKLLSSGEILSSRTKLTVLFQNLIENGLKYNKSKIPTVEVDFAKQNDYYSIDVKDNGIGIDAEYQDQIFDLFSRLHTDQEYEGTGIGLSTCKKIVEDHLHGKIDVNSEIEKGTTFNIKIPVNK